MEEKIKVLDEKINECISNIENAKSGAEVKVNIIEYERLMFCREKIFTDYIIQSNKNKYIIHTNEYGPEKSNAAGLWLCIQGIAIIFLAVAVILIKQ